MSEIMLHLILPHHSCNIYEIFYFVLILIITYNGILYYFYNSKLQILLYSFYAKYYQFIDNIQPNNEHTNLKSELGRCFNLACSTNHGNECYFSNKELLNSTPDHIYAYMSFKVFGTITPLESDKSTQGRSNSIEYAKKAILYLMPN